MASPQEIEFAKQRFTLQRLLNECLSTAEAVLDVHFDELKADLHGLTGPLLENTIANQHQIHTRRYGADEVGYIIAADHNWAPLVFVTSSLADPLRFEIDPEMNEYRLVRKALVAAIKAATKA